MGVVYYANYLIWMEVGRAEYCRAAGIRYRDMEVDDGILLAVVEAHCRYLRPARYDQEIAVKTRVANASRRAVEFDYEIRDAQSGHRSCGGRHQARVSGGRAETSEAAGEILAAVRYHCRYLNSIFDSPVNL